MAELGVHIVRISPDFNNLISSQIVQQKPQSRQFLYHGPIPVSAHRPIPKNWVTQLYRVKRGIHCIEVQDKFIITKIISGFKSFKMLECVEV